jgi:hypothetical protein
MKTGELQERVEIVQELRDRQESGTFKSTWMSGRLGIVLRIRLPNDQTSTTGYHTNPW